MTFTAQQIAQFLGGELRGNNDAIVSDVARIEEARPGTLCFLGDQRFIPFLSNTQASVVLISRTLGFSGTTPATLIIVDNARAAMASLLTLVEQTLNPRKQGIEQPCFIASGNIVEDDVYVGAFAYIGRNVKIGRGVQIYPQCYVGDNCTIGDNTVLYAGARVYLHCVIGLDCIIHSGCVIGADGFGFETDAEGVNRKVPQTGNVVIEDDVEIGANTCIDRAMMGSTIVRRNAKLDTLVQVAHNDEVGGSTFLCAQVGIAGSTRIGSHCILTGQVGVAGHIEVADRTIVGAQAGVAGTIREPGGMYQGSPAIPVGNFRRSSVAFKQLPELQKLVYRLEKEGRR